MTTIEVDPGVPRAVAAVLAFLLLCAMAFVVGRSMVAERRGEDVRRAALGAFRAVVPPLLIAGAGVVVLATFVIAALLVLIWTALIALAGDSRPWGFVLLVGMLGVAVLLAVVVGAVGWGVVRAVRASPRRR